MIADRIARRFVAEKLTKEWLMAVRRGWLTLMKPSIHDYGDVFRAIGKVVAFSTNLRDQVLNVRRGPYTSPGSMTEGVKLEEAFAALKFAIVDAKDKAQHWYESYEGIGLSGQQRDARQSGEHMLALYQKDFVSATSGYKEGRGGTRSAELTELFDDILKLLYVDVKRIKNHDEKHPDEDLDVGRTVFKEFQLGGAKVVVLDQKTNGAAVEKYIDLVDKAYQDLKRKGFGKVWYGVILITLGDYEKLSPWLKEEYEKAGYANMDGRAGTFHSGEDLVKLTAPPTDYFRTVVIHEMGHRYWFKFMTTQNRATFEMVIEGTFSKVHALLLNHAQLTEEEQKAFSAMYTRLEAGKEPSVQDKKLIDEKYKELGLRSGVPLASQYAHSSLAEAFAEVFEKYVNEADLTRDQVESFRSVLSSEEDLLVERLLGRFSLQNPAAQTGR